MALSAEWVQNHLLPVSLSREETSGVIPLTCSLSSCFYRRGLYFRCWMFALLAGAVQELFFSFLLSLLHPMPLQIPDPM